MSKYPGEEGPSSHIELKGPSYTVFITHFGDIFWVAWAVQKLRNHSPGRNLEVVLIDQSRDSQGRLAMIPGVNHVVSFPPDNSQIAALGHDHPAALNRALQSWSFTTTHAIVFDSDCFPIDDSWLVTAETLGGAIVAADPVKHGLSHPCFMLFPSTAASDLDFAEGVLEVGIDTGRLVGFQLQRHGFKPTFSPARAGFGGQRGHLYLNGTVYHHGSASLAATALVSEQRPKFEAAWRRIILTEQKTLSWTDKLSLSLAGLADRFRR